MRDRICKRCGKPYYGTASSKYCVMCKDIVMYETKQAHYRKNKQSYKGGKK